MNKLPFSVFTQIRRCSFRTLNTDTNIAGGEKESVFLSWLLDCVYSPKCCPVFGNSSSLPSDQVYGRLRTGMQFDVQATFLRFYVTYFTFATVAMVPRGRVGLQCLVYFHSVQRSDLFKTCLVLVWEDTVNLKMAY